MENAQKNLKKSQKILKNIRFHKNKTLDIFETFLS